MTDVASPLLTLNNGVEIPALGLGVYMSAPEDTAGAVRTAIENGYRLIDTAAAYGNEREVGEGLRDSSIDRSEVFVTTKLWISDFGHDSALRAFETSMDNLGLDYLDLYLLHWPIPSDFEATIASYKAAEKVLAEGRVRVIGVCNFNPQHLEDLVARTDVVPAANQVELHPYFAQKKVRGANASHGVLTQSWYPIGGVYKNHPKDPDRVTNLLDDPTIGELASKHGKTPAQVVLRWHIENGLSAIPKSVRAPRIAENIGVFDFALSPEDVATIDALDAGMRGGPNPDDYGP
jgi:diketogulonate reductase-like aldo/keto reductase